MSTDLGTAMPWTVRTDESDGQHEPDRYGHVRYVDALLELIESTSSSQSIGLLGGYGTGKSWIIRELHERIRARDDVGFLQYDAWRYAEDEVRRDLLVSLRQQAIENMYVDDPSRITWTPSDFKVDIERTDEPPPRLSWMAVRSALRESAALGLLYATAGAIFGTVVAVLSGATSGAIGASLGLGTGALWAADVIRSMLTDVDRLSIRHVEVTTQRRVEFAEEFTEKFSSLLRARNVRQLVIVVDNLDRCAPDVALRVLSTVKNFLEPLDPDVHFVIPCDSESLQRHLTATFTTRGVSRLDAQRDASDYLDKVFSSIVTVTPFSPSELRASARDVIRSTKLASRVDYSGLIELSQVVAAATRISPREMRVFVNKIATSVLLAEKAPESEAADALDIAKMLALAKEAPELYALIRENPNTLAEAERRVALSTDDDGSELSVALRSREARRIVRALRWHPLSTETIVRLLGLRIPPEAAEIPRYFDFRAALEDGDWETAQEVAEATSPDALAQLVIITCDVIRSEASFSETQANARAVGIALLAASDLSETQQRELLSEIQAGDLNRAVLSASFATAVKAIERSAPPVQRALGSSVSEVFESLAPVDQGDALPLVATVLNAIDDAAVARIASTVEQSIKDDSAFEINLRGIAVESRRSLLTEGALEALAAAVDFPADPSVAPVIQVPLERLHAHALLLSEQHVRAIADRADAYLIGRLEGGIQYAGVDENVILQIARLAQDALPTGGDILTGTLHAFSESDDADRQKGLILIVPDIDKAFAGDSRDAIVKLLVRQVRGQLPAPADESIALEASLVEVLSEETQRMLMSALRGPLESTDSTECFKSLVGLSRALDDWSVFSEVARARAPRGTAAVRWFVAQVEADADVPRDCLRPSVGALIDSIEAGEDLAAAGSTLSSLGDLWTTEDALRLLDAVADHLLDADASDSTTAVSLATLASTVVPVDAPELEKAVRTAVEGLAQAEHGLDGPDALFEFQVSALATQRPDLQIDVRRVAVERLAQIAEDPTRALRIADALVASNASHADPFLGPIAEFALRCADETYVERALLSLGALEPVVTESAVETQGATLRQLAETRPLPGRFSTLS